MRRYHSLIFFAALLFAIIPIFSRSQWNELWVAFVWPAAFVIQLFIVTWPVRTVPLTLVLWAFLLGAGPLMGLTLLIQEPIIASFQYAYSIQHFLANIVGKNVDIGLVFLAPVSEEILKILPLVLVLLIGPWRHLRYTAGPLDFAVLGAALGAGFQFMETIWSGIVSVDLHSYARLAEHISPHIGSLYVLPTLTWEDGASSAWFGHAGVTATLALAMGVALRRRASNRLWWLLPIGVGGLVTFEHFLSNLGQPSVFWAKLLYVFDLRGVLSSLLFVIGAIWMGFAALRIARRYHDADPETAFGLHEAGRAILGKKMSLIGRLWLTLSLLRLHRALAFGLDWLGRKGVLSEKVAISLYSIRSNALTLKESLLRENEISA